MSDSSQEQLNKVKHTLGSVSPSFCLAKWQQVTIHLHNGTTHSCHHPPTHKIPLAELKDNPSALHNTSQKLKEREMMLRGERPEGCNYCWRVEDLTGENLSDRYIKSGYSWSYPYFDEVMADPLSKTFVPRYVEVNMGDVCNFKCSYCTPEVSTKWMAEIKEHGPYPTAGAFGKIDPSRAPIRQEDNNPYLEAWWKWWPELYPRLHTFRVTGGEPLLNSNFTRTLDWICENPHPNLVFGVNTNLCPPEKIWQTFLDRLRAISKSQNVKKIEIYTSAEAWGDKAEYIRFGMDFELWRKRVWELLDAVPSVSVTIMATYNALSVTSFDLLLDEVLRIKREERFYNPQRLVPIFIDVSYLRSPGHQSIKVLPPEFEAHMARQAEFMLSHAEVQIPGTNRYQRGFLPFEAHKMERIRNWFAEKNDQLDERFRQNILRRDFYRFFTEHDRRRKTDFAKTFPEYREFMEDCSKQGILF